MEILDEFLTYMGVVQGSSLETIRVYSYELNLFIKFILQLKIDKYSSMPIDEIELKNEDADVLKFVSLEDVHNFLLYCRQERGNGAKARARKVASVRSFYKYLYNQRHFIEKNIMEDLETPKIGKKDPIYLTEKEAKQFISGIKDGPNYYRDKAMMIMILNMGLRVSELCGINLNDIRNNVLTVRGKGNKERSIFVNGICQKAIDDYLTNDRNKRKNIVDKNAMFISRIGKRIGPRTVQEIVKNINYDSQVNKPGLTTHKLRHTMATMTYRMSNDLIGLQQLLGHDSINSTQIYTHVDREQLKELVELNPLNEE